MRKILLFFALFVFLMPIYSQEIVTNANIEDDDITIGEEIEVNFDINDVTDCDSYDVDIEIDYDNMEIVVTVDYSYDSDCDESDVYTSESIELIVLLEGTYDVSIVCDVSSDFNLDQDVDVGELTVEGPENSDCFGYIPQLFEFCPSINHPVCACNGQNYDNECVAYFEEENGAYYEFVCGNYLEENSEEFNCGNYRVNEDNVFANYSCGIAEYSGSEKYFKYEHEKDGDSLLIFFNAKFKSTRMFLTKISSGDIECIEVSDENRLFVEDLESGTYYIIVDSDRDYSQYVEICSSNLMNNTSDYQKLYVYPNPISTYINIQYDGVVNFIRIYNSFGIEVFYNEYDKNNIRIKHGLRTGVYFANIKTENGIETRKLVIK